MKVYNKKIEMTTELVKNLSTIRLEKSFCEKRYIKNKCLLLNKYMSKHNLKTCIVPVSGGIDSSVVLGIAIEAQKEKGTPINNIIAVSVPSYSEGVTNQESGRNKAKNLCDKWNIELNSIDLTDSHKLLSEQIENNFEKEGSLWTKGQLVPCLRTTSLYYLNSLLWDDNEN